MSKQRHIKLEYISKRNAAKLQNIAGAYRLGNITKTKALTEAEKTLQNSLLEIIEYIKSVPLSRDLGKQKINLSKLDFSTLKGEVTEKLEDFKKIIDDAKHGEPN